MKRFFTGVSLFVLILMLAGLLWFSPAVSARSSQTEEKLPFLVVIDSYHQGDSWADNEIAGLVEMLQAEYPDLTPVIERLDTKHFPDPDQIIRISQLLKDKYKARQPDLVVVLDDPALHLILEYREQIFPGVPVVFAGVNYYEPGMLDDQQDITGVREIQDFSGTLEMALLLQPQITRVLVISDYTVSGMAVQKQVRGEIPKFEGRLKIEISPDLPFDELAKILEALTPDQVVVIMTYVTDQAGRTFARAESTRLITSHSPVPVYAMHETRLGYGIIGGELLEGKEHGRQAAGLVIRILKGESASAMPVEDSRSRPYLDYNQLVRFSIPTERWPEGAALINQPVSFWQENKAILLPSFAVILLLASLSAALTAALLTMKRSQESERASQRRYQTLFETMSQGVVYQDAEGKIISANPAAERILGLSLDQMQGRTSTDPRWRAMRADGSDFPGSEHPAMLALKTGQPINNVLMGVFDPSQEIDRWIMISAMPEFKKDETKPYQVYASFTEITERIKFERQITRGLKTTEGLLQELYHRTKNNMQVLSSLLMLHAVQTQNEEARRAFRDMDQRIQAMSLVHQQLYQNQDLSVINLQEFIRDLSQKLIERYLLVGQNVAIRYDLEPVLVTIDFAIPFSLILNELIANAFNHAFEDSQSGAIQIQLHQRQGGIELDFSDNGVGLPEGFEIRKDGRMGFKTILALVEYQLGGQATFHSQEGLHCQIHFRDHPFEIRV